MTVIAWDGATLAGDKRMSFYGLTTPVTKIFRAADGSLLGFSGAGGHVGRYRAWFDAGAAAAEYPVQDGEHTVRMMAVRPCGRIELYERSGHPMVVESPTFVLGSGQDYAAAAMHLGCDAVRAVEVATALNSDCGDGVDTLTLEAVASGFPNP